MAVIIVIMLAVLFIIFLKNKTVKPQENEIKITCEKCGIEWDDKQKDFRESKKLPTLADPYIDASGDIWETKYRYDTIDIQLVNCKYDILKVNEIVQFVLNAESVNNISSINVLSQGVLIGYINTLGQRRMIRDYLQKEGHMVQAQISYVSKERVFLRVYYYISKKYEKKVAAERKAQYEAEKASYVRKQPISFDTILVNNGKEQMQWEIQQVRKGAKIEIEPDDNDRYLVSTKDSYDIGYVPKRISDKIEDLINDVYEVVDGEIIEITENAGKYGVKVHIVLEDKAYL